jgi:hypothetical protein
MSMAWGIHSDMKTDGILWLLLITGAIGVVVFGMKPKVCMDDTTGNTRSTYAIFPCGSNESAITS